MNDFNLNDVKALLIDNPSPTGDTFLDERYEEQLQLVGHYQPYYRLFYRIAELLKPDMVVELGGWQGTAAAHFAGGGEGTVASIDHHGDPGDDLNKERMLQVAQHYSSMFYFQGWTWDVVGDVKALGKQIDILFIDSWHVYKYAIADWNAYSPLLADIALVIVDDIFEDPVASVGIVRFWEEISAGHEAFTDAGQHPGIPMGFMKWTRPK